MIGEKAEAQRLGIDRLATPKHDEGEIAKLRGQLEERDKRIEMLTSRMISVLEARPIQLDSGDLIQWRHGQHYWRSLDDSDDTVCLLCGDHWVDGVIDGGCNGP